MGHRAKDRPSPRAKHGRVRIGCSGWEYRHWKKLFYPDTLPHDEWLSYYAKTFDTVEVNNSFYRLPSPSTVARWRGLVPRNFKFAWKASRFLTHNKKLKDATAPLERMAQSTDPLGTKLGPILFQLPPRWKCNPQRLIEFAAELPRRARSALEIRDPSWYDEAIFSILEKSKIALCLHDMPHSESPRRRVGPFVYVRFHGARRKYGGRYTSRTLRSWARFLADEARSGVDVFAYFNNDAEGAAPHDARRLRDAIMEML